MSFTIYVARVLYRSIDCDGRTKKHGQLTKTVILSMKKGKRGSKRWPPKFSERIRRKVWKVKKEVRSGTLNKLTRT